MGYADLSIEFHMSVSFMINIQVFEDSTKITRLIAAAEMSYSVASIFV